MKAAGRHRIRQSEAGDLALLAMFSVTRAQTEAADLELVLAMNATGGISNSECIEQPEDTAAVFHDPAVQAATISDPAGSVALARSVLVQGALDSGRLAKPFDFALPGEYAYYIVCPEANLKRPKVKASPTQPVSR